MGQIADGVATPIVGLLSDRTESRMFGKRTVWYIAGTLLYLPSTLATFSEPLFSKWSGNYSRELVLFYYSLFGAFTSLAWAAVQISNMALVVSITYSQK